MGIGPGNERERLLLLREEREKLFSRLKKNPDLVPLGSRILSLRSVGEAKPNVAWCFCRSVCAYRPDLREPAVYVKILTFIFKETWQKRINKTGWS